MRLTTLAALIVVVACCYLGGAFEESWDAINARCAQPALSEDALARIGDGSMTVGAGEAEQDDMEISWARYCEPCDPPLAAASSLVAQ